MNADKNKEIICVYLRSSAANYSFLTVECGSLRSRREHGNPGDAARAGFLQKHDDALRGRGARQLQHPAEAGAALGCSDLLDAAYHRDVMQMAAAVFSGGNLGGGAVLG